MNEVQPSRNGASFGSMQAASLSRRSVLKGAGALAATFAAGSALAGCATPGGATSPKTLASVDPTKAKGDITLWMRDDDLLKVMRTVVPDFNALYPNVNVKLVGVDVGTKLPPALASGSGLPDGSFYEDNNIGAQADHLYDLTSLMAKYRADTVGFKLDVATYDKRLVGVPWDTDPGLLYYNNNVLDGAGVDPASLTTYDQLLTAASAIKSRNAKALPIPLEQDPTLSMLWFNMFLNQQQGHGLVDSSGKLALDSAASRKTLEWIRAVADEGLGARQKFASTAQVAMLDNGTLSLMPWAVWFIFLPQSGLKKTVGQWRMANLPAWTEGGARSGVMGGSSFVIPAKAKNPELAWLFYEFACYNPKGYGRMFSANTVYPSGLNTVVPSVKSALDPAKPLVKPLSQLGGQDNWAVTTKAALDIPSGYTMPSWFGSASTYLGANLQKLMDKKISVEEVIDKSSSDIQSKLIDRS